MKALSFILAGCALVAACTAPEADVRRVLSQQGMTHIKLTGHRFVGCSEHDQTSDGFEADSITGARVTGVVCGSLGWGKAYTIRFD